MAAEKQRMWCKVAKILNRAVLGYTQENDLVLISRTFKDMKQAEPGDIVSFIPQLNNRAPVPDHKPAKWFAIYPQIIARKFCAPVTRAGESVDAFAWKAEQDSAADEFSAALQ
jgi:hypothetical protein